MTRLKVHNLPSDVNAGELKKFFMNITPMATFNLQRNKHGGESFALLTYDNPKDAGLVLQTCKNKAWSNTSLNVTRYNKAPKFDNPINLGGQSSSNFNRSGVYSFTDEYSPMAQNMNSQQYSNNFQGDGWEQEQSFNMGPFRKRGFNQTGMGGPNNDHELNNLAEERRSINQRIMLLENSMRLTANNIQQLSDCGPVQKVQRFSPKSNPNFRGPSYNDRYQERFIKSENPRAFPKPTFKSSPPIQAPGSSKYKFNTTLVRKLIHCYVHLYGVNPSAAITKLGETKILTPGMVKYASGGKITIKRSPSDDEQVDEDDDPDVVLKRLRMVKNRRYWKKEMKKILDEHHTDHRFIDILKREGPANLLDELLQGYDNKEPTEFDDLPKCPEPPENYFKVRDYLLDMKKFYTSFTKKDFASFNLFKKLFSSAPLLPKDYRRSVLYYVQVLGIYAIKDKKFVVHCLSRKTTVIVIKTEPTLILGFLCEKTQKEVLDRNGECICHIKLYLRPYEPLWCKNLAEKHMLNIKKNTNDLKKSQIRLWTQSFVEFYAPYIPLSDLPNCDKANSETFEVVEEDIAFIFDEAEEDYTVDQPCHLYENKTPSKVNNEGGENGNAVGPENEDTKCDDNSEETKNDNSVEPKQPTENGNAESEVVAEVKIEKTLESVNENLPKNEELTTGTPE